MSKKKLFIFIMFLVMLSAMLYWIITSSLGILGPSDKPDFKDKSWQKVRISYWVKSSDKKYVKRTFTMANADKINSLRERIIISDINGYSLGGGKQIEIVTSNEKVWLVTIVFDNKFIFTLQKDNSSSYIVNTQGADFFDSIKVLCFNNELKIKNDVGFENIVLRANTIAKDEVIFSSQQ